MMDEHARIFLIAVCFFPKYDFSGAILTVNGESYELVSIVLF